MSKSIKGTRTEKNLLASFAGESQARNRYTYFASAAKKEGYEQIAAIFLETAENEKEHAKVFFKHLEGGDLEITATYPAGAIKDTRANLAAAAAGEKAEWGTIYPDFAKVARSEGFPEVARSFPEARLIETGANLGFAGGVNRGLAEAAGRFIAVLNPDIDTAPGALDLLVDFLEAHPETGIAAPKLLNADGTLQHSCRRFYTLRTILLRRTFLGRLFPNSEILRRHLMLDYDHAAPRAVDWVAGAAMVS
mgnify:CR=1 FL=1